MNIFVANLDYHFKTDKLKELFEEYGEVTSAKIITDFGTGKSKGFGFVEMPDDSEARSAINSLNEHEINGRAIVVKEAKPRS